MCVCVCVVHNFHPPFVEFQRRESLSLRQNFNFKLLLIKITTSV